MTEIYNDVSSPFDKITKMSDIEIQYWLETDRKFEEIMKEYDALTEERQYLHSRKERYVSDYDAREYVWIFVCLILWIAFAFLLDFYIMI